MWQPTTISSPSCAPAKTRETRTSCTNDGATTATASNTRAAKLSLRYKELQTNSRFCKVDQSISLCCFFFFFFLLLLLLPLPLPPLLLLLLLLQFLLLLSLLLLLLSSSLLLQPDS